MMKWSSPVLEQKRQKTLEKTVAVSQRLWASKLCAPLRELQQHAESMPHALLEPARSGVRKGFVSRAHMVAAGGFALGALGVCAGASLAVTTLPMLLVYAVTLDMGSLIAGSVVCALGLPLMACMATMGFGVMKGSFKAIDTYFIMNGKDVLKSRPPEEISEARANILRRHCAAQEFKAAAVPVETGATVTPMKALKLKQPPHNISL